MRAQPMQGQMSLFAEERHARKAPSPSYPMPCPVREQCGAYILDDGIAPDGTAYARGCDGKRGWCARAMKAACQ